MEALGGKDKQLAAARRRLQRGVRDVRQGGREPPEDAAPAAGRAAQDRARASASSQTAANVLGPTLTKLQPVRAKRSRPRRKPRASSPLETTPIIKNEIRPFAREILPVVNELAPSTKQLAEAFPKLATSFSVLNEFFNELAYNPGPKKGGFLFFLDWGNHDLNSVVSTADAHGPARTQPRLLQLRSAADPQRRLRSEPDGEPARRPAQPPHEGRMPEPGAHWHGRRSEHHRTSAESANGSARPARTAVRRSGSGSGGVPSGRTGSTGAGGAPPARRSRAPPARGARGGLFAGPRGHRERGGRAEMQKRAPTLGNILVIILFALSCFGLLLFLWESFGGPAAAEAEGLPLHRRLPAHARARRTVGRAHQRRERRPRRRAETRQRRPHRTRPSKSPASTRRSARTCTRSCARRRCSARPTCS